jgi:hypothetical protein
LKNNIKIQEAITVAIDDPFDVRVDLASDWTDKGHPEPAFPRFPDDVSHLFSHGPINNNVRVI